MHWFTSVLTAFSEMHTCCSTASRADAEDDSQRGDRQLGNEGTKHSQARNHGELVSEAVQIQKKQIYGVINSSVFEVAIACSRCED